MHKHFCVRGRNALICAVEEQEHLPAPSACASVLSPVSQLRRNLNRLFSGSFRNHTLGTALV